MSSCCVCVANIAKRNPEPELIVTPYKGKCPSFYDKKIEEDKISEENLPTGLGEI